MHRAGLPEAEISEGHPRGAGYSEGRSLAHRGVPSSPSCLSIVSKPQVVAAVMSMSTHSRGVCRVKRRQRWDVLGAVTNEGQMEPSEPAVQGDAHREGLGYRSHRK